MPDGKVFTMSKDYSLLFFYPSSKIKIPGWPMSSLEGPEDFKKPHSELTEEEVDIHRIETDNEILRFFEKAFKV